ncbi:hypothetical protein [Rossellomorea sp. BNER]|uniref:hypothetical protein n=1 Tax=Rossellomorea sp. BNER TaxID=2962031 RepID=UPI003AF1FAD4
MYINSSVVTTHLLANVRIDIPIDDEMLMNFLRDSGFEKVSQPPIMIINSDTLPTRNNNLYGIAAQIFG